MILERIVALAVAGVVLGQEISFNDDYSTYIDIGDTLLDYDDSTGYAFNAKISSGGAHIDLLSSHTALSTGNVGPSNTAIISNYGHTNSIDSSTSPSPSFSPSPSPSPSPSSSSSTSHGTSTDLSSLTASSTYLKKCDSEGASLCDSSSKSKFFKCVTSVWMPMACTSGTECRIVNNNAVCVDPSTPTTSADDSQSTESLVPCATANATMCDSANRSSFYMCVNKNWTKMKCEGANVCISRNKKTMCVSEAEANAPVQPCTSSGTTQCAHDNKAVFQTCVDNYWTNSTCSDGSYCLYRAGSAMCVDKALAEAPQIPCSTANATQCFDGDDTIYQICYQNYWSNSTCDKGNVCGMSKDTAVCHDPSQPIVDIPEEPCSEDGLKECIAANETLYRVCTNGLWANLTCADTDVCRLDNDNNVICLDKDQADLSSTMGTLYAPSPYIGHLSGGPSLRAICLHGASVMLTVVVMAIGASI